MVINSRRICIAMTHPRRASCFPSRRLGASGVLLLVCCLCRCWAVALSSEEKLKAAYVFNFLKFTSWPALSADSPIELCLANASEEVKSAFALIDGQKANGRIVHVRQLPVRGGTEGCQVYYLKEGGIPVALRQLVEQNPALLTIGDDPEFIDNGGIIGFVYQGGRLQFDINLQQLKSAEFRISAQLLKLARNTHTE